MHIVVLCATQRGLRFLNKLSELQPDARVTVFSFKEEAWEPPFLDDIHAFAGSKGWQFFQTKKADGEKFSNFWENSDIDLMFLVSWRYKISAAAYSKSRMGTYVFHDSYLPEGRGFSPTVWAIIRGQDQTGVTLFEIAEDIDSGDIIDQKRIPIARHETIADIIEKVTQVYIGLLESNLAKLIEGKASKKFNDPALATYNSRRTLEDNLIRLEEPAYKVYNLIRAVTYPYPGAYTFLEGRRLTIWSAEEIPGRNPPEDSVPGTVLESIPGTGSIVSLKEGTLLIKTVQFEGGNKACAADLFKPDIHKLGA